MGLVKKDSGYPVNGAENAAVTDKPRVISDSKPTTGVQLSAKERSIVRQTAWKIAGPMAAHYASSPDEWFAKALEYREKIENDMKEA